MRIYLLEIQKDADKAYSGCDGRTTNPIVCERAMMTTLKTILLYVTLATINVCISDF